MTLHKTKTRGMHRVNIGAPQGQTDQTKWLHIKVQKVCKAVYEPHRDKQRTSH